ncbi:MAG: chemotaxis response regulator protein-glutamate methylesterase [Candidatus Omnitrophota bacterium]
MRKPRVVIIEDSIIMQKLISDICVNDLGFDVVANVYNGQEALEKIPQLKPDLITLDINLPDMYGLGLLKDIMAKFPTRVVMISAYTQKGAKITMKGLELGALDFIPKPSGEVSLGSSAFKDEIITKMKIAVDIDVEKHLANFRGISVVEDALQINKVVVIAASTGGPSAIIEIMKDIPADIPASFLIIQHMPDGFTRPFAERVSWYSKVKVKEAEDGDSVLRGAGYIAPAGTHMLVEKIKENNDRRLHLRLDDTPLVNYVRPSADVTLKSLAELNGANAVCVVLTGMGKDGMEGARAIKEKGGVVIVQDKETSVVYGMPRAVAEAGLADEIIGITHIAEAIIKRVR